MKKTVNINLWGQVFHIDEDAFELLQNYLVRIEKRFSGSVEGKEIMGDVESRIAELFREKLGTTREVINIDDVNSIMGIIGSPEDFGQTEEPENNSGSGKKAKTGSKRLYRNPDDRILGGVGGGLAAYFGIDPTVTRLLLILTLFFSGPLIYIILWIIVPEANTTTQKLEMSGEPINLSNIEKKIKDEFGKVKDTLNSDKTKKKVREATQTSGQILGGFFHILFRSFVVVLGIAFLLLGSVLLIAIFLGFFIPSSNGLDATQIFEIFFDKEMMILAIIGILLLLGIPLISLIISGIRMIFGIKFTFKILRKTMVAFFICGLILTGFVVISQVLNYKIRSQIQETIKIDSLNGRTLVLNSIQNPDSLTDTEDFFDTDRWLIQFSDTKKSLLVKPSMNILKTDKLSPEITINKICHHKSKKEGQMLLKKLPTLVGVSDTTISLTPCYQIQPGKLFRFQEERITLYIPVGTKIVMPVNMAYYLDMVEFETDTPYHEMFGKTWIMTEKGLRVFSE